MARSTIIFFLWIVFFTSVEAQVSIKADKMGYFYEGLLAVQKDNKWGFVNEQGELIVDYRNDIETFGPPFDPDWYLNLRNDYMYHPFNTLPVFSNERCIIKSGDKYGFINTKGNIVIKPKYDAARPFYMNHALVMYESKVLIIDIYGNEIGKIEEPTTSSSDNEIDVVCLDTDINREEKKSTKQAASKIKKAKEILRQFRLNGAGVTGYTNTSGNSCFYFYDLHGKLKSNRCFAAIGQFSEGSAPAQFYDDAGAENYYGVIDSDGKVTVEPRYKYILGTFSNGMLAVYDDDYNLGYIDKSGNLKIPMKYAGGMPFYGKYTVVKLHKAELQKMLGDTYYKTFADFVLIDQKGMVVQTFQIERSSHLPRKIDFGYLYTGYKQTYWISENGQEIIKWPEEGNPLIVNTYPGPFYLRKFLDGAQHVQFYDYQGKLILK
ncbi:WG repeat-containing protein [Fulvivirga maritima]|uniref:WG repeat-containing protein n=1 Tax=Fulvivirga maritima TaxID=2904247 RepID=UPI001F304125|nr:WG repeat-containing protein [Fulvivirga maritima]UII25903.1 WG repeat-containing protein [Fulvivirga maritima]